MFTVIYIDNNKNERIIILIIYYLLYVAIEWDKPRGKSSYFMGDYIPLWLHRLTRYCTPKKCAMKTTMMANT
jgi:hypothetical protein